MGLLGLYFAELYKIVPYNAFIGGEIIEIMVVLDYVKNPNSLELLFAQYKISRLLRLNRAK